MIAIIENLMRTEVFLGALDRRLRDYTRFWSDFVAPFIYSEIATIFETEGRGRWPALDPAYAARKAITHPGRGILRREDTFYEAATSPTAAGSLSEVGPLEFVLGVDSGYFESSAGFNYPGAHESGEGLPARPVFSLIAAGAQFEARLAALGEQYEREEIAAIDF